MPARLYGVIPAAGTGTRLGGDTPKQYLEVAGRPMLWHAVAALAGCNEIETVFVVLAPGDERFDAIDWSGFGNRVAPLHCGGATRRESVYNGLVAIGDTVDPDDWVLVHDAARPCLGAEELARLVDTLRDDDTGGLLALPVPDTVKRAATDGRVASTEPREGLWLAQTPQMFRHGTLLRALGASPVATDESAAVEALGMRPRLVKGSVRNLKVTYPGDESLAALWLAAEGAA
jgi:2-C-methyl-D-erythritol 4-phosphate cytidylyltransferase